MLAQRPQLSIVIDLDRGDDGKRRQKWFTVQGTRKDADKRLTELLHELDGSVFIEPHEMTVEHHLKGWLDKEENNVAPKTFHRYREIVIRHLIPALGRIELLKLKSRHIDAYYADAIKTGRIDGKGGLSPRTLRQHHAILHKALKQAVRWELIKVNPAEGLELPKIEHREMQALTEDRTRALLEAVQYRRICTPVLVAVTTGLRRGELLALRWKDVDLDRACSSTGCMSRAPMP